MPFERGPTNHPAATVVLYTHRLMYKPMEVLQLNMQIRREVQHSVIEDPGLKEYTAAVVSEPYIFEMDGKVRISPMGHQGWTAILPSDGRWAVRSMLWVRRDVECEQVSVPFLLRLLDRLVLLASVYVEGSNIATLSGTMRLLGDVISTA